MPNEGPGLLRAIEAAGERGTLIVASIGQMTELMGQYISITATLARCKIRLRGLDEGTDDTTVSGRHTLGTSAIRADWLAATAAGERSYWHAVNSLLPPWDLRLDVTESAVLEAGPPLEDLEAELEAIEQWADADRISAAEYIRLVAPLNARIRARREYDAARG